MKKLALFALTVTAASLVSLPRSYGQSSIAAPDFIGRPITAADMEKAVSPNGRTDFGYGGNSPYRRGCILKLCDKVVSIDQFGFGNNGRGSELIYKWTVHSSDVASFSISTVEYDTFNNPLTRESWIIPIDDNGDSRTGTQNQAGQYIKDSPQQLEKGFGDLPYYSAFSGVASNADLLEHFTPEQLLGFLPSIKGVNPGNLQNAFSKSPDYNREVAIPGGFGLSTRYTVVTFISHIRFTNGSVWDAPGSSLVATGQNGISGVQAIITYAWGFATYNETRMRQGRESIEDHLERDPPGPKKPGA